MKIFALSLIALTFILTGCSNVKITDFAKNQPVLHIEEYFSGRSRAWGMVQDRHGAPIKSFTVDLNGQWDASTSTLTLKEDFVYSDGTTEQRLWKLVKVGDNKWQGSAGGVVGLAKGESAGNAYHMTYTFDLPYNGSTVRVHFDDWMFLQPDGVLLNKARMSKFGWPLADVTISFSKFERVADERVKE